MEKNYRRELEVLLRRGDRQFVGGSEGTPLEAGLDVIAALITDQASDPALYDDEELLRVIAWRHLGFRGAPWCIMVVTSAQIILDVRDLDVTLPYEVAEITEVTTGGNRFSGHWVQIGWSMGLGHKCEFLRKDTRDEVEKAILEVVKPEVGAARGS